MEVQQMAVLGAALLREALFHPLLVSFLRMSSYVTDGDEPVKALETKKSVLGSSLRRAWLR